MQGPNVSIVKLMGAAAAAQLLLLPVAGDEILRLGLVIQVHRGDSMVEEAFLRIHVFLSKAKHDLSGHRDMRYRSATLMASWPAGCTSALLVLLCILGKLQAHVQSMQLSLSIWLAMVVGPVQMSRIDFHA